MSMVHPTSPLLRWELGTGRVPDEKRVQEWEEMGSAGKGIRPLCFSHL